MNFAERPPSTQWAPLKYRGETLAEAWFKPEGEPLALSFRVHRESSQIPEVGQRLTPESLLRSVGVAIEEVESWSCGGVTHAGMDGASPELRQPLPPHPPDATHLEILVRIKPPAAAEAPADGSGSEVPPEKWQDLETRWRAILALEAHIGAMSLRMDSVRVELEGLLKKSLAPDERVHASNADVAQWNKEKNRAHFALPKAKEFIHRATWANTAPEKKTLDEVFKNYVELRIPFPGLDKVPEQLEHLLKLRQVLSAQGVATLQECQGIAAAIQGAVRTLLRNSAANAAKKRDASRTKGKHF